MTFLRETSPFQKLFLRSFCFLEVHEGGGGKLLRNYLLDRKQHYVVHNNSNLVDVTAGMSQRLILDPLLLNIIYK